MRDWFTVWVSNNIMIATTSFLLGSTFYHSALFVGSKIKIKFSKRYVINIWLSKHIGHFNQLPFCWGIVSLSSLRKWYTLFDFRHLHGNNKYLTTCFKSLTHAQQYSALILRKVYMSVKIVTKRKHIRFASIRAPRN